MTVLKPSRVIMQSASTAAAQVLNTQNPAPYECAAESKPYYRTYSSFLSLNDMINRKE